MPARHGPVRPALTGAARDFGPSTQPLRALCTAARRGRSEVAHLGPAEPLHSARWLDVDFVSGPTIPNRSPPRRVHSWSLCRASLLQARRGLPHGPARRWSVVGPRSEPLARPRRAALRWAHAGVDLDPRPSPAVSRVSLLRPGLRVYTDPCVLRFRRDRVAVLCGRHRLDRRRSSPDDQVSHEPR